jgi:hypothetical protein
MADFTSEIILSRLLFVLALYGLCAGVFLSCHRALTSGIRLCLSFSLAMYVFTFHAGCAWLFVWRDSAIGEYFDGAMNIPEVNWEILLITASLPLFFIPLVVLCLSQFFLSKRGREIRHPVKASAIWGGVVLALAIWVASSGHLVIPLFENSLSDLTSTSGLLDLYTRRREQLGALSSFQAGFLYSTVPACATVLLFIGGSRRWVGRVIGILLAVVAIILNAGLFQIGPILAFGLMVVFCVLAQRERGIPLRQVLTFGVVGLMVFGAYLSLKDTGRTKETPVVLELALRMPIALPYLFQMSQERPHLVNETDSLPHELGEFMFPEFAGLGRFVAMPQPAFVSSWFQWGPGAAALTLAAIGLLISVGGRLLDLARSDVSGRYVVLVAVGIAAPLYYSFQVTLIDVLVSSYGLIYVGLPSLLVVGVNYGLRILGAPLRRARRAPPPLA